VLAILFGALVAIGAASPDAASDPPLHGIYAGTGTYFLAELDFTQSPSLLNVWAEASVGGPLHSLVFSLQQVGPEQYSLTLNRRSCGVAKIHLGPTGLLTMTSAAGELRFAATGNDVVRGAVDVLRKEVQQVQTLRHDTGDTGYVIGWPLPKCSKS
jgi:hypothetical protein